MVTVLKENSKEFSRTILVHHWVSLASGPSLDAFAQLLCLSLSHQAMAMGGTVALGVGPHGASGAQCAGGDVGSSQSSGLTTWVSQMPSATQSKLPTSLGLNLCTNATGSV